VRYVFGLVPAGAEVPDDLVGLDEEGVHLVTEGDLAVVVGGAPADRPLGRRADLFAHSRVLDAFAQIGPVVPTRFGSVMQDENQVLEDLLRPNREHFSGLLQDLEGRAQFTLRARYDETTVLSEVVSEDPEIARLREETRDRPEDRTYPARVRLGELVARAMEAKRDTDGRSVLESMVGHAVAYDVQDTGGLDDLIEVAFLVEDGRRDAFDAAAERVAEAFAGRAKVRLLGPLAPYNFVPKE